ncbi:MAG: hypothetical protein AB7I09_18160 [Planctomycetota bacterium]
MEEDPTHSHLAPTVPPEVQLQVEEFREELRSRQNLMLGALMGLGASLLGAAGWALTTYWTGYQIGWLALGVGFLVGVTVRRFGRGVEPTFGVLGAILALGGCALGNLSAACAFLAHSEQTSFLEVASKLDLDLVSAILRSSFDVLGIFFYGLAAFEGFRLSFRRLDEAELQAIAQSHHSQAQDSA